MNVFTIYPPRGPLTAVALQFHAHGNCWTLWRVRRAVRYSGRSIYRTWWRFTLVTERLPR